ncbi:YdiY family protein [Hyphomonas sp.]|uniref:DUF481 domain-containing protein n=1 Tax=Hyphomonas sp. TaxID=87 RepID=UPI00391B9438
MKFVLSGLIAGSLFALPALAETRAWTGEGSFSAGVNTGNTETSDFGLGVKMTSETQIWRNSGEFIADYGTKNGSRTKNRFAISGQFDRTLNDNLFGFARVTHEQDEFSGFNSRSFLGSGLGWFAFDTEATKWSLEGGPGIKLDDVKTRQTTDEQGETVIVPSMTDESLSFIAASRFSHIFSENVRVRNDTSLIYADVSTQIGNKTSLTASLTRSLSARFSVEVRHDTDPPSGFTETDTSTRMSLVYSFGG